MQYRYFQLNRYNIMLNILLMETKISKYNVPLHVIKPCVKF